MVKDIPYDLVRGQPVPWRVLPRPPCLHAGGLAAQKRARFRCSDCSNPFDETQRSRLSSGGYDRTGGRPADVGAVAMLWGDGPYKFDASLDRLGNSAALFIVRCENIVERPLSRQADIQAFCSPICEEELIEIDNRIFAHEIREQYFEPFVSSY